MRDLPRVVWVLAAGRFVNAAGSFMYLYLFVYLVGQRHLSLGLAGLISGGFGVGLLLGNFTGGWFGDHLGHRRTLLLTSTLVGVGTLAIPALPSVAMAAALPMIGYTAATAGLSQGALVALAVPVGDRRRSIAITRAAFNAGTVIGPPLGALISAHSFTALFVIDGLVTLAVRVATARALPAEVGTVTRPAHRPGLWRSVRTNHGLLVLLPAIVVVDVVYRQLYSTLPVFLSDHRHPITLYALLIALGSGMILCLEVPVAIGLRRFPGPTIIAAGYALVGVGFAMFSFATGVGWVGVAMAVTAMVVLTIGEILYKTTATAHVLDAAPPALVGQYQGLYTGAATSGTILAPPIGALIYGAASGWLWPLCAGAAILAAVVAWLSGRLPTQAVDRAAAETVTTTANVGTAEVAEA